MADTVAEDTPKPAVPATLSLPPRGDDRRVPPETTLLPGEAIVGERVNDAGDQKILTIQGQGGQHDLRPVPIKK